MIPWQVPTAVAMATAACITEGFSMEPKANCSNLFDSPDPQPNGQTASVTKKVATHGQRFNHAHIGVSIICGDRAAHCLGVAPIIVSSAD